MIIPVSWDSDSWFQFVGGSLETYATFFGCFFKKTFSFFFQERVDIIAILKPPK